jgi:hypothetical protein
MKITLIMALLALQDPGGRVLSGLVQTQAGEPVRGANVFLVETLEGAISDSAGRFRIATHAPAGSWLVTQRIGFSEVRVQLGLTDTMTIVLGLEAIALPALNVQAGRFQTGSATRS